MRRRSFLAAASATLLTAPAFAADRVRLRELYEKDMSFTDFAVTHQGRQVEIFGYMAPPLKAESDFFVLTNKPMSICPFCESEAAWPDDIVAVYASDIITATPFNVGIVVKGELELGTYRDEDFGFVSRVRLVEASYWRS